ATNSSGASTTVNYAAATVERDGSMDLAYAITLGTTSDVATGISGYTTIFAGPRYNIFTKSVNAGSLSATTSTMDESSTTLSRRLIIQAPITVIDASQSASV